MRAILPALLCFLLPTCAAADERQTPNILLIMADDMGIEGLGCYGGTSYQTPHLDQLAAEGLRFTTAYAQPLCTPTRVQLMTGQYNHRNWTYFGILDPSQKTFGHHLQASGYTTGIFGKWQLQSYDPPDLPNAGARRGTGMHPKDAGFDEYALFHALHTEDKGSRYANPSMLEGTADQPGTLSTYRGRYGEDIWVEKIVDFFDRHRAEPTFCYYPMALPHRPFEPTPNSKDWDPDNVPEEDVSYIRDMVEYMDTVVGRLLSELKAKGLRENTLVLFYADNGFHNKVRSDVQDGREIPGGKAKTLQTAIHVPLIAHWPGHIKPGLCDDIVDASDFLPTLLELTNTSTDGITTDGTSFAPALFGRSTSPRQTAFFWYDSRPGWDKERFRRSVFAVNRDYKLFRSGRLYRLSDTPLQETAVDPLHMTDADRAAQQQLQSHIDRMLADGSEPPLVDAYGRPEHNLLYLPKNRKESDAIGDQLEATATQFDYGGQGVKDQTLRVYTPLDIQPEEKRPCVFFIHGGGWGGHPRMLAPQSAWLQRRGYVVVNIHFRAPRGALTPHDTLRDARAAYRWTLEHADQLQIDTDRIVVSGGSAGGHLSLALFTIGLEDDPALAEPPRGLVLFNPAIDLVDGWSGGRKKCEQAGIDPTSLSPAHHVHKDLPPTLVLSGEKDTVIAPPLIRRFQQRMKAADNDCRFIEYPGAGHGFFNYGRENNVYFQWTMWAFEDFLNDVL
ncbi:MAG: sulfatase-like hydrolase/transferase [Planctomycetaceae bacterium]|nr:sulfatase-like hydrolase/transferase [Planctomycetaceae bacterium]